MAGFAAMQVLGVDLAWGAGPAERAANETGVVALDRDGTVLDAGWTVGLDETVEWMERGSGSGDALAFVDAPLVVSSSTTQGSLGR